MVPDSLTRAEARARSRRWGSVGLALRPHVLGNLSPQPADPAAFIELDRWLAGRTVAGSVLRVVQERRDDTLRALRCGHAGAVASDGAGGSR